ncbi:hypothetical protein LYNGBM3L_32410 [Moorena producens 3L]|uniref:Uncharacterized protein n=1 Tax=Moorena producens 3L TaxID=489825 RepID=F4XTT2_9CYAN|nr:hypothetical protein LYNGBM3L_32410 [Moorena producens 3L]
MKLVMSEVLQIYLLKLEWKAPALKPGVSFLTVSQLANSDQKLIKF